MNRRLDLRGLVSLALALVLLLPAPAAAQWYVGAYLGGNSTQPSDVTVDQPAAASSFTFRDVHFSAEPLKSPQYYGYRFGRMFGAERRWGVEFELIHLKVIADTARTYQASGLIGGDVAISGDIQMNTFVQRYSMTHGLNYLLGNVVWRTPIGAHAVMIRGGLGPTLPHAETTVNGIVQEQYEYGGPGVHGAAGLDLRIRGRFSAMVEYKLTMSRPEISVALGGNGRVTAVTHQIAVGLAFGQSR